MRKIFISVVAALLPVSLFAEFRPEGAQNLTFSPDSSKFAYTKDGDLFFADAESGEATRLTFDGSELILNGYASWVYYEEIFGRSSEYKAFWWSPDSKTLAFYRFDNSKVTMFPIYSPFFNQPDFSLPASEGSIDNTRYPLAGGVNPSVRIGFAELENPGNIVWADFDEKEDQYFGTPFWGPKGLFVAREPRIQNCLDLYCVSPEDGSKSHIYHEKVNTWLNWMEDMLFTDSGLYMVRDFESGFQQIYFLSYDGKVFRRITDGSNWRVKLIGLDRKNLYFTAQRDAVAKSALYKVSLGRKHKITALTDPQYNAANVEFSHDFKTFTVELSNFTTPTRRIKARTASPGHFTVLKDSTPEGFVKEDYCFPQLISMTTEDGYTLPAAITYPRNFDPSKKYPVHFEIYGGPNTAYVRDRWRAPNKYNQWFAENGIIHIVADVRTSGHNGRRGLDEAYKRLSETEIKDYLAWAYYLRSKPYVNPSKFGVEGFSFGGTNTALLLLKHSDVFQYGIAGGGVYDWRIYDSHYTERFMQTPQTNAEGYEKSCVLNYAAQYPVEAGKGYGKVMLRITHGTADDNVHFQSTLLLVDALQRAGKSFEFMIYPDGKHGYRNSQREHSFLTDCEFWTKYLLN